MNTGAASDPREEVLGRIRSALRDVPLADAAAIAASWRAIDRSYIRSGSLGRNEVLELLEDRLHDYDANVVRAKEGEVSSAIAHLLATRGLRKLVVPQGLEEVLGEALPEGFTFVVEHALSSQDLDAFDGIITASTCAIAETGTIVLQYVPGQGRRAPTLIPDYHLCIVRATDVVETVPEATAILEATSALATTFFSGPSATADIEMTRIKGVHGPRFLDVILVP